MMFVTTDVCHHHQGAPRSRQKMTLASAGDICDEECKAPARSLLRIPIRPASSTATETLPLRPQIAGSKGSGSIDEAQNFNYSKP